MAMDESATDHARRRRRYAVIVRTHFWDSFAAQQSRRLRQRVQGGDIFAVADEVGGAAEHLDDERVLQVNATDVTKLGLPPRGANALDWAGDDSPIWFNGDRALYTVLRISSATSAASLLALVGLSRPRSCTHIVFTMGQRPTWPETASAL